MLLLLVGLPSRGAAQNSPQPVQQQPLFGAGRALELTIDGAMELALKNNYGLKIEDLSSEASLYVAKGSWGAFDWTANATAGITDDQFKSTSVFGGSKSNTQSFGFQLVRPVETGGTFAAGFNTDNTRTDSTFSALSTSSSDTVSLSYSQPLLRGAWRQYATAQQTIADLGWRRQVEHERQIRQKLLFDVSNAYWDLVAAKSDREVADSNLGLGKTQLDQDRRRLDAGVGIPIDVLSSENAVANREAALLAADVKVRQTADALRRLILPGADAARWETDLVPITPLPAEISASAAPEWSGALDTALQHRAELREQKFTIDAQKISYSQRVSEKRPGLDLGMSAIGKGFSGDSQDAASEAFRYDFPTYQATLTFSYPLQNRAASGAERAAWANLRAANLAYDDLETQVAQEVREALRQVVYQAELVAAATKSLDLAQRQLDAEEKRHQAGETNYFQLLTAQQRLAETLSVERNARANFAKSIAGVATAQGLIGEDLGK